MQDVQIGWSPEAARPRSSGDRADLSTGSLTQALVPLLAALSASAGGIHLAVVQEHLGEYSLFGIFFALLAVAQLAWAWIAPLNERVSLYALAAIGNLLVIALWIWSRTIGLPIGPEPNRPEVIGLADAACSAMEAFLVVGATIMIVALKRRERSQTFTC